MDRLAQRHNRRLAFALFLLAPLVGEYLLGNQPITALPGLFVLAPMYGGGALLIRETARRTGRGWPTMVLLAAAYALIEEGPIDQMLWNPHYGGVDLGAVYAGTHVSWLGTSVAQLQSVLSMHTVWSICVPIAIVESFTSEPTRPWLGKVGLRVVGVVFVAGSLFLAFEQQASEHFMASAAQFMGASVAIVGLIALAFQIGRRAKSPIEAVAPPPWVVGLVSLCMGSLYWATQNLLTDGLGAWIMVSGWIVLAGGAVALFTRWSRTRGWCAEHRLALAAGAMLTYVWVGVTHSPDLGIGQTTGYIGNAVFGIAALILLATAAHTLHYRRQSCLPSH